MCLGTPKMQAAPIAPTKEDAFSAGNKALLRMAGAKGPMSTIASSLTPTEAMNPTPKKSLLGQ